MAQETRMPAEKRTQLREFLVNFFDEEELRTLCFDMGIEYASLPGIGKASKARELIAYLDRRGLIPKLAEMCQEARPNISTGLVSLSSKADDFFSTAVRLHITGDLWEAKRYYEMTLTEVPFYPRASELLSLVHRQMHEEKQPRARPEPMPMPRMDTRRVRAISLAGAVFVVILLTVIIYIPAVSYLTTKVTRTPTPTPTPTATIPIAAPQITLTPTPSQGLIATPSLQPIASPTRTSTPATPVPQVNIKEWSEQLNSFAFDLLTPDSACKRFKGKWVRSPESWEIACNEGGITYVTYVTIEEREWAILPPYGQQSILCTGWEEWQPKDGFAYDICNLGSVFREHVKSVANLIFVTKREKPALSLIKVGGIPCHKYTWQDKEDKINVYLVAETGLPVSLDGNISFPFSFHFSHVNDPANIITPPISTKPQ